MATVLITGGTGMIGTALSKALSVKGYDVIVLTRSIGNKKRNDPKITYAAWDTQKGVIDNRAVAESDYVVHLAGEGIADKRWTAKRKKEIEESRTKSSAMLVKALNENPNKVKAVVSASAIGWYGADSQIPNPDPFTETFSADNGFLGETCRRWEESIEPVTKKGIRLVKLRTGIVMTRKGGALPEFEKPLRFGVATILGGGDQRMSWIHLDDLVSLYIYAIENSNLSGAYNAVSPQVVSNKELILTLAKLRNGNKFIPIHVPSFALKIVLGEMSIEVLKSATVSSNKIREAGFKFTYENIDAALDQIMKFEG